MQDLSLQDQLWTLGQTPCFHKSWLLSDTAWQDRWNKNMVEVVTSCFHVLNIDPFSCMNPIWRSLGCKTVVKQKTLSASLGKVSAHDAGTCQPTLCRQEKEMSNSSLLTNRWANLRTLTICFTWPIPFIELPTISGYLDPKWPIVSLCCEKTSAKDDPTSTV